MANLRNRSSAAPAFLALSCVGILSSPASAQDQAGKDGDQRPADFTVTSTLLSDSGYKVDEAASRKYTAPLLNTPKSVTVLPSQVIQESGSTTIVEALRNVPGITFGAGEGGNPQGDRPFIRGFDAQGSTYTDGIRSVGGQSREIFAVEQIEVVKGGDSTMGGRGSAGGSLNLVSKMPHLGTGVRADLSYGTDDYKRATIDANYQVGKTIALRLNAMWHDADVAGRNVVTNNRWGISPSIALGLGTSTRAFLNYYHLETDDIPDTGIPFERPGSATYIKTADQLQIGPAEVVNGQTVNRRNFYGLANRDFRTTNVDEVLFRFERDLSDTLLLRTTAKYANAKQDYIVTQPDDSQGNVTNGLVWRRVNTRWSDVDSMVGQIDLSGSFHTGGLKHSFAAGFEGSWEKSNRGNYSVSTNITSVNAQRCSVANQAAFNCTSLFNPNPYDNWQNIPANGTVAVPITKSAVTGMTEATTYALYAYDTISITDSLLLNLGLRHDWYETIATTVAATGSTQLALKDSFFNYQAGLVFKPVSNGSLYVSFAKSTTPAGSMVGEGSEGNAIAATTLDDLKAEETKSYEVGTKWEFMNAALGLNLALFRTETTNSRTTGANGLPEYVGERRIQGVEVGFNGKPLPFWSIFGGYTYMDSEVRNAGVGNINNGKPFPNTPKHSFTTWTTLDLTDRFQIGGGAFYNSKQYGNFGSVVLADGTTGTVVRSIPGYWRFDATAAFDISENVALRVNVLNLANKKYYDRTYGTHFATMAAGRSAFATLSLKF